MVSSADRTIFGFFREHLEEPYESVCGDTSSFDHLDENAFKQFLRDRYTLSRVPLTNAWADMVKNAFVDFLAGGLNCPEQSTYKQTISQRATIAPGDLPEPAHDARTRALSVPAAAGRGPQYQPTRPGETPRELIEAADQLTGEGMAERGERPTGEMIIPGENAPIAPPAIPTPSREPPADSRTVSLSSETRSVPVSPPAITVSHGIEGIMDQYRERLRDKSPPGAQLPQPPQAPTAAPPVEQPAMRPLPIVPRMPPLPPRPVPVATTPPPAPPVERPAMRPLPVTPIPPLPPRPVPVAPPQYPQPHAPFPPAPPERPAIIGPLPVPPMPAFPPRPAPVAATPPTPPSPAAPADVASAETRDLPARSEQAVAPSHDGARESAPTTTLPVQSDPLPAVPPPSVPGENLKDTILRWTGAFPPQLGDIQDIQPAATTFEAEPFPPHPLPVSDLTDTISPEMRELRALMASPPAEAQEEIPPDRLSFLPAQFASGGGPGVVIVPPEMSVVTGHTDPLASPSSPARAVGTPQPAPATNGALANRGPAIGVAPSPAEVRASTPPPARSTDPLIIDANANRIRAIQLAKDIENAKTPAALLRAWMNFRTLYFDILERVTSLMQAIGSSGRFSSMPEHYDDAARGNIFQLTTLADVLINEVMKALDAKLAKVKKPKSAEMAFVMAQRNLINGLKEKADALRTAASASGRGTDVIIRQNFAAFRDEMNRLTSPITWTEALLGELKKFKKYRSRLSRVTTSLVGDTSRIKFDNPSQYTNIIEQMILEAAKWHWHDVRLNFEWNQHRSSRGYLGTIVITSPKNQLRRFRRDREFAARIGAMEGRWDLPGRLGRIARRALPKMQIFGPPMHRLSIPIPVTSNSQPNGSQGSGPSRNSPPPPAAGAASESSLSERLSGLEETLEMEIEAQGGSSEAERTITGFEQSGETNYMSGYGPQIPVTVTTPTSSFFGSFMNFFGMPATVPQTMLPLGGLVFQGVL